MDPRKILFAESAPRRLLDDDENKGVNCAGCYFQHQKAAVCRVAAEEAMRRGLRDCDAVDQFGDVVVYVRVDQDPRQMNLIGEEDGL